LYDATRGEIQEEGEKKKPGKKTVKRHELLGRPLKASRGFSIPSTKKSPTATKGDKAVEVGGR